ncbi:MAG: GPP34 family phosphoprotein [Myxococcota bacterium]
MSLTLPETLLLFALHDDRGTVHSVAYLGLDHALRGAVLAELKLRGHLQVRTAGDIRHHPSPPERPKLPFLCDALDVLASAKSPGSIASWLDLLAKGLPDLRARALAVLERRGILTSADRIRAVAAETTYPLSNRSAEDEARDQVVAALDAQHEVSPRLGVVIALTVACHLDEVVFGQRRDEADARAAWVADRDAVVRAVVEAIAKAEGQW